MSGECMIVKSNLGWQKICLTCGKKNAAVDACKAGKSKSNHPLSEELHGKHG